MSQTTQRTIVVPLDGSALAEQSLPLAVSLACSSQGKLLLALVHQAFDLPDVMSDTDQVATVTRIQHEEGEAYLRSVAQRFRTPGLTIDTIALFANLRPVGQVLQEYVEEVGADLVVLATHGRGGLKRAWLGSVADFLIRHLTVPALIMRTSEVAPAGANQILVPLDGSPLSETILSEASTLARETGQELTLLQVVQPIMRGMTALEISYVGFDEGLMEMQRNTAEDYLADLRDRVQAEGVRCTSLTVIGGGVADCIIEVARPAQFTMIAMATHGRTGLRRLALGSVADKVIRGADVPVLVHRPVVGRGAGGVPRARVGQPGLTSYTL
jgi:nucleotide-binding universal stress UspA family protein